MAKLFADITRTYRHLPASVYLLFATDVALAAGNFVFPFLTLYLTLNLGLREDQVGLLIGVSTASCVLGTVLGGFLADLCSRKQVVLWAMGLSALAYLVVPVVSAPLGICALIVTSLGIMAASKPAYNALVADFTGSVQRKAAFSLLYLGVNVGFAAGPLVASTLYDHHAELLFFADAAMTIVAATLIHFLLNDQGTQYRRSLATKCAAGSGGWALWQKSGELGALLVRRPLLLVFLLVYMADVVIYSQIFFALPLQLSALFGQAGPHQYGVMMTINAVCVVVLSPVVTHVTRKRSPGENLLVGGLLLAAGIGTYHYATSLIGLFGLVVVWSVGEVLTNTNAQVFISEQAAPAERGRLNVLLELACEAGFGLGPLFAGLVVVRRGVGAVFPWAAALGVVTFAVMATVLWADRAVAHLRGVLPEASGPGPLEELPAE
jgi:predicted MFS family arabinose efflux permease